MASKPIQQAAGSGVGAALALVTYAIQLGNGHWDWAVQSAAQDVAVSGLEFTLPWLASLVSAILAGLFGVRAKQAKALRQILQGIAAVAFAILPAISLWLALQNA